MKFYLIISLLLSVSAGQVLPGAIEYVGRMPTVEVIAHRYDADTPGYVGAMPEVTVTAPRYAHEDDAWSGLMPVVEVTAIRPAVEILAYSKSESGKIDKDLTISVH